MNPTRLPKEVLRSDWERRGMKGTKGDRVQWKKEKRKKMWDETEAVKISRWWFSMNFRLAFWVENIFHGSIRIKWQLA
jgi:hypothetical protein